MSQRFAADSLRCRRVVRDVVRAFFVVGFVFLLFFIVTRLSPEPTNVEFWSLVVAAEMLFAHLYIFYSDQRINENERGLVADHLFLRLKCDRELVGRFVDRLPANTLIDVAVATGAYNNPDLRDASQV